MKTSLLKYLIHFYRMRLLIFLSMVTFETTNAIGQYSFESMKHLKVKEYNRWKFNIQNERLSDYLIKVPNFFKNGVFLKFEIVSPDMEDRSVIKVFKKNKLIQTFKENYRIGTLRRPQAVFEEDVNGDGLNDLKIIIPNYGCGGYNYYLQVIYLFQNKNGTFTKASFLDLMVEFENRIERDFDNDGNFEIVTQTFQSYGAHNYWLFNLYNFNGEGLVNVNQKANYPIMVPLDRFKITKKISRSKMKRFKKQLPDDYSRS